VAGRQILCRISRSRDRSAEPGFYFLLQFWEINHNVFSLRDSSPSCRKGDRATYLSVPTNFHVPGSEQLLLHPSSPVSLVDGSGGLCAYPGLRTYLKEPRGLLYQIKRVSHLWDLETRRSLKSLRGFAHKLLCLVLRSSVSSCVLCSV
jgi:hypothetical protein